MRTLGKYRMIYAGGDDDKMQVCLSEVLNRHQLAGEHVEDGEARTHTCELSAKHPVGLPESALMRARPTERRNPSRGLYNRIDFKVRLLVG